MPLPSQLRVLDREGQSSVGSLRGLVARGKVKSGQNIQLGISNLRHAGKFILSVDRSIREHPSRGLQIVNPEIPVGVESGFWYASLVGVQREPLSPSGC